jgi:hypothetical protein
VRGGGLSLVLREAAAAVVGAFEGPGGWSWALAATGGSGLFKELGYVAEQRSRPWLGSR